jgi:predicted nucleic acid-binding protein
MITVFADTSYWIALTNVQDIMYEKARSYSQSLRSGAVLTTGEVLIEYLNYFAAWGEHFRHKASENVKAMLRNRNVRILPQAHETFLAGLNLYRDRLDKGYSLTDCISMQTMRREGLTEVLSSDRHFEQEGSGRCSATRDTFAVLVMRMPRIASRRASAKRSVRHPHQ